MAKSVMAKFLYTYMSVQIVNLFVCFGMTDVTSLRRSSTSSCTSFQVFLSIILIDDDWNDGMAK